MLNKNNLTKYIMSTMDWLSSHSLPGIANDVNHFISN